MFIIAQTITLFIFIKQFLKYQQEIPGTVRIVLSAADPQRTKNQVVYSIPDRCFIPLIPENSSVELFDQTSSSVYVEPTTSSDAANVFNPGKIQRLQLVLIFCQDMKHRFYNSLQLLIKPGRKPT